MRDALDACIQRLRRGSSLELALADCGAMTDAVRPLAALAEHLSTAARPAPAPSADRMAAGRARFLAAAGTLRASERSASAAAFAMATSNGDGGAGPRSGASDPSSPRAPRPAIGGGGGAGLPPRPDALPAADDDDWLSHALDAALAQVRQGASIDAALATLADDLDGQARLASHLTTLVELLMVAADLTADLDAHRADAPTFDPAAGRSRFLAAAAALASPAVEWLDRRLAGSSAGATAATDAVDGRLVEADALAAFARQIAAAAAPVAIPDLSTGRERFLAAAEAAESQAVAALDAGLAAATLGTSVESALRAAGADGHVAELGTLVTLARSLADQAAPAAAPDLSAGRARFLSVAEQARTHHAAVAGANAAAGAAARAAVGARVRMPAAARVGAWLRGGETRAMRPLGMRLGVMGTMAAALLLSIGVAGRVPAVATAIPGDALYSVKEWSRGAQLFLSTFDMDAARREQRRARINADRLTDTLRAQSAGRMEEASFSARYDSMETAGNDDSPPHGTLWVTPLDDAPKGGSIGLTWRKDDTRFDLPAGYDSLGDVPKGVELRLKVRTGETEMPLALRVSVKGLDAMAPMTATATITATTPATLTVTPVVEATAEVTATLTVTATAPVLSTPTSVVTATERATPGVTPTETASASGEEEPSGARNTVFEGIVQRMDGTRWEILNVYDNYYLYVVDVSRLSESDRAKVKNNGRVRLMVTQVDKVGRTAVAVRFDKIAENCQNAKASGLVREYLPGDRLVIEMDGVSIEFRMGDGPMIEGEVRVGGEVRVEYRVCGGRTANIADKVTGDRGTATAGTATTERVTLQGVVLSDPIEDRNVVRFDVLAKRNGEAEKVWAVQLDPANLRGAPKVTKGVLVEVVGRLVNREQTVILAERVTVKAAPRPTRTPAPTETAPPSATPAPSETPTVETPTTEPTTVGAGAATAEPALQPTQEPGTAAPTAAPPATPATVSDGSRAPGLGVRSLGPAAPIDRAIRPHVGAASART